MKKIMLMLLLVVGMTTFAQEKRTQKEKLTSEQHVELQVKKMKLDLNLNDKQSVEVKKVVAQQVKRREAKRAEHEAKKDDGTKPTANEIFEMRNEMLDEQIAIKNEMKKILNAEQFVKWEKIQAERKDKMKNRIGKSMHDRKKLGEDLKVN